MTIMPVMTVCKVLITSGSVCMKRQHLTNEFFHYTLNWMLITSFVFDLSSKFLLLCLDLLLYL